MTRWTRITTRLRPYAHLREEIEQDLEERTEALVAAGVPRAEAVAAARKAFGNVLRIEEESRAAWGWRWIEDLWVDLRCGARQLAQTPGLLTACVLTLGLGVGANAAVFTVVDAVLIRAMPYRVVGGAVLIGIRTE